MKLLCRGDGGFAVDRGEFQFDEAVLKAERNVFKGMDDPVSGGETLYGVREKRGENFAPGGMASFGSGSRIFNDETVGGVEAKEFRALEVRLGMGLAVGDQVGGDEALRDRNTAMFETDTGKALGSRGDDSPGAGGKLSKQFGDAGKDFQPLVVFNFEVFNALEAGLGVDVGAEKTDGIEGTAAMRRADGEFGIYAVLDGPALPAALDGAKRADQDAVHIEKNAAGLDLHSLRVAVLPCRDGATAQVMM